MKRRIFVLMMPLVLWLVTATAVMAQTGGDIDLSWHVFGDGGVTESSGGNVTLSGTLGQTAAGPSAGGVVSLNGGFWQVMTYASLSLVKEGSLHPDVVSPDDRVDAGDTITYAFTVENTGNVPLDNVTVTDLKATVTGSPISLAVGALDSTSFTAAYTITQADMDSGSVTNTAYAANGEVTSPEVGATVTIIQNPSLSLTKTAAPATYSTVGDVITCSYTIKNTGNVTLTGPFSIADNKVPVTVTEPADGQLSPNEETTGTGTYNITQADLDSGSVTNTASANNGTVISSEASATVTAIQNPALSLTKTASPATYGAVGTVITYSYTIKNTGNVTLNGPFNIADNKAMVNVLQPADGQFSPDEEATGTTTYTISQPDLDSGSVTNTASATNGTVTSNQASTTVTAIQSPALSLTKTASPATYSVVGEVITYSYSVKNTGNMTLSGPFSIADNKAIVSVSPPADGQLSPDEEATGTATFIISQPDLDSGSVTNTAYAASSTVISPDVNVTVTAIQSPNLSLTKNATEVNYSKAGDVLHYTLVATNEGNVTLTGVSLSDPKLGTLSCSPAQPCTLAPGATLTGAGSYSITQADLDGGKVDNTANAGGMFGTTPANALPAGKSVPAVQTPHLSLIKSAIPATYDHIGQVLNYTLVATNDGNVTLTGVSLSDPKLGTLTCTPAQPCTLAPGATLTATGSYVITPSDLNAVDNVATSSGRGPQDQPVTAEAGTTVLAGPSLSIVKTSDQSIINIGDTASYTITVHNAGPGAAYGVAVTDPLPAGVTWTTTTPGATIVDGTLTDNIGTLPAGATVVIHVSGPTTPANAGLLANTVSVTSSNNNPALLTAADTITVHAPNIVDPKTVELVKDADGDGGMSPGDTLRYTNKIYNTGNGTAFGVIFADTPDMNTTLVVGSVTTTGGFVTKGNIAGPTVEVNIGEILPNETVTITFSVTINDPLWEHQIANQAIVKGVNFSSLRSDDPGTTTLPNDPTIIQIKTSPPVHVPSISEWGIMTLTTLLGGGMLWKMRRRQQKA